MRSRLLALLAASALGCAGSDSGPEAPQGEDAATVATAARAAAGDPDIWLAPLTRDAAGAWSVGSPVNVTDRPGYDNQPFFLPDGSGFWYTAIDREGQADIWRYDLQSASSVQVTATSPESEYSPTPLPDGTGFSVIRVEADSMQRLWRFDPDGSGARVLLPNLAPVGYQAWSGEGTLVLFVLGSPSTLHVVDAQTGAARVVAEDVGRSLQPIPGGTDVSFVKRVPGGDAEDEGSTEIRRLDPATGESTLVAPGVGDGDFHAWLPDGTLVQADGPVLMAWRADHPMWMPLAEFSAPGLSVSRLAAHPDGTLLALVAERTGG